MSLLSQSIVALEEEQEQAQQEAAANAAFDKLVEQDGDLTNLEVVNSQVNQELQDIVNEDERVEASIESLIGLYTAIESIKGPLEPEHRAMIASCMGMAVAGTGVPHTKIAPSLESADYTKEIALEAIGDAIKNALFSFNESTDSIVSNWEKKNTTILALASRLQKEADSLSNYVTKEIGKNLKKGTTVTSRIYLGVRADGPYGIIKNKNDLFKAIEHDKELLARTLATARKFGVLMTNMQKDTLKSFTSKSKYVETLDASYKAFRTGYLEQFTKQPSFKKVGSNDVGSVFASDYLMGKKRIVVSLPKLDKVIGADSSDVKSSIKFMRFQVVTDKSDKSQWARNHIVLEDMSLADVESLIKHLKDSADVLDELADSTANSIKMSRNFAKNLVKVISMLSVGATAGAGAYTLTKNFVFNNMVVGAIASYFAGSKAAKVSASTSNVLGKAQTEIDGFFYSFLSLSIFLQNRISKYFTISINDVSNLLIDNANVCYGAAAEVAEDFNDVQEAGEVTNTAKDKKKEIANAKTAAGLA